MWSWLPLFWPYGLGGGIPIDPDTIPSEESVPSPAVTLLLQFVEPTSIESEESLGSPLVAPEQTLLPDTIDSAEAIGDPVVIPDQLLLPTAIGSEESFGTAALAQPIYPDEIATAESFGSPALTTLPVAYLTGYWRFNQGDPGDSLLPDDSGHYRDGYLVNGTYVSDGTYGGCIQFNNATPSWGALPDSGYSTGTGAKTLLVLCQTSSTAAGFRWAAAFGAGAAFFIGISGSALYGGGFANAVNTASGAVTTNTWMALALTYEGGTGGDAILYKDGVQVATTTKTWSHTRNHGRLGRQIGGLTEYWAGKIAQVVTFDGIALTAAEIAAWAADPFGSLEAVLVDRPEATGTDPDDVQDLAAWWKFGDLSHIYTDAARTTLVTTAGQNIRGVTDLSGNSRHASNASGVATYATSLSPNGAGGMQGSNNTNSRLDAAFDLNNTAGSFPEATIFFAVKLSTNANAAEFFVGHDNAGFDRFAGVQGTASVSGSRVVLSNQGNYRLVLDNVPTSTMLVVTCKLIGSGHTVVRVNGQQYYVNYGDWASGTTSLGIGAVGTSGNTPWRGAIFEAVIYGRPLTDDEIIVVEDYLMEEYAVPDITAGTIASAESFGSPVVSFTQAIQPNTIASVESVPSPTVSYEQELLPDEIGSAEAFGTLSILTYQEILPDTIDPAEDFGALTLLQTQSILPDTIASAEAFGTLNLAFDQTVLPGTIASGESFGTPFINAYQTVVPGSIESAEAFGTIAVSTLQTITPDTVESEEDFGPLAVVQQQFVLPAAIESEESLGSPLVAPEQTLLPDTIASAEDVSAVVLVQQQFVLPGTIASLESLGNPSLSLVLSPDTIGSEEDFGNTTVIVSQTITPSTIASAEDFGTPAILQQQVVSPNSVASEESFGNSVTAGPVIANTITSEESVGNPRLYQQQRLYPDSVLSTEVVSAGLILDASLLNDLGRLGMHVDQTEGESFWPLVGIPSSDVRYLLSDGYLAFEDDDYTKFKPPYSIKWLYGFGLEAATLAGSVFTPVHAQDAIIRDSDGLTVFDSRTGSFHSSTWADIYQIYEWTTTSAVLRLVKHKFWPPPQIAPDYQPYSISFCPDSAVIAARVTERIPKRVRSIRLGDTVLSGAVRLRNGYNTSIEVGEATTPSGSIRKQTEVTLTAQGGLGLGTYNDCDSQTSVLRTINGVQPTTEGRFSLGTAPYDCHRITIPTELASEEPRVYSVVPNTIEFGNDCESCCSADDCINVNTATARIRTIYKTLGVDIDDLYRVYKDSNRRWNEATAKRRLRPMVLDVNSNHGRFVNVGGGYCNQAGDCLGLLELRFEFQFVTDDGSGGEEEDVFDFDVEVVGCSTHATSLCSFQMEPTSLTGTFPTLSMFWDVVPRGAQLKTFFRLDFTNFTGQRFLRVRLSTFIDEVRVPYGPDALDYVTYRQEIQECE